MRLSSRKLKTGSRMELSMTSMIDVVFLLLIFFMTTSSFVKTERELDSAIKVKSKSRAAASNLEPAIIDVTRGGSGAFVFKLGSRELTSPEDLVAVLSQFENKFDGAFVRVADEAPFEMAAAAVQACKTARFAGVTYVPQSESP